MPVLSVIIPVYKVEAFLERCIDSVLSQDYNDIEVILVDDGSPDNCPKICDSYAQKDQRVKVIHKENGGLSSARNAGIRKAVGEYIVFLDSDDAWADNKLKEVVKMLSYHKTDMLLFSSQDMLYDGSIYQRKDSIIPVADIEVYKTYEYYKLLIKNGNLHESACTKIINRTHLIENELYFCDQLISEDTEWMFRVLRCINTVSVCHTPLLIYTVGREGSISNSADIKSATDLLWIIKKSIIYYENDNNETIKMFELQHCAYLLSIVLGLYGSFTRCEKNRIESEIKSLIWLLQLNDSRKIKLVRMCYNFLGLELVSRVLSCYISLNKKVILNRYKTNG